MDTEEINFTLFKYMLFFYGAHAVRTLMSFLLEGMGLGMILAGDKCVPNQVRLQVLHISCYLGV